MRFERSVQGVFLRGKEECSSRGHRTAIAGGTFASPSAGTAPPGVCTARPVRPVSRARDMQVNPASDAIVLARPGPRHSRLGLHGSADPQGLVDILARRGEGRHGRAGPGGRSWSRPPGEPPLPEIGAGPPGDPACAQQTLRKPPRMSRFCRRDLAHCHSHGPGCCSRPQCLGQCLVQSWDSMNNC